MSRPALLRHWKTKAVTQKTISLLPGAPRLNYFFQCHVTGTAARTQDWFLANMTQAARHLSNWRAVVGADSAPARAVELGTGWHVTVPVCLALWGAEGVTTVDRTSLLRPARLADSLRLLAKILDSHISDALPPSDASRWRILLELADQPTVQPSALRRLGVDVYVGDVRELPLPAASVDLFVSNNVLEHIPTSDLPKIFAAYRRLASEQAVMSHFIDLADHFSAFDPTISSRNFLQYSDRQWRRWDNDLVHQNRLQLTDYRRAHVDSGFTVCFEDLKRAPVSDLSTLKLAPKFTRYPTEELLIETAWMVSRPSGPTFSSPVETDDLSLHHHEGGA